MSIEELSNVLVTSVSKRPEHVAEAPAAVYVVTREDILRSGVTSIPEALRLAPGVEVTRNGSHSWVIAVRGFNRDITNKLQVLIDGRSVYSPLYAGVFWDVQDVLLTDIDRIEVVAGPGGALWGANAVNGVINIITRSAEQTKGARVEVGGGREERSFAALRYGADLGDAGAARSYIKYFDRDGVLNPDRSDAPDGWHMVQGGFRADWRTSPADNLTLQGDVYRGREKDLLQGDFTFGTLPARSSDNRIELQGHNLLGRWERTLSSEANFRLQLYFDHTSRDIPGTFKESRNTIDLDFQHGLATLGRHNVLWGVGMHLTRDDIGNTLFATFDPARRTDHTFSAFAQDKIELHAKQLYLTLGTKLEHNDYTGFEYQPNIRLNWLPDARQTVWAAISRAVRIPARLDTDLRLTAPLEIPGLGVPLYATVYGSDQFDSEELLALEAGYRIEPREHWSFDLAAFDNHYDGLQTMEGQTPIAVGSPPQYIILPFDLANGMKGRARGATAVVRWKPSARTRLQLQYTHLDLDLRLEPGSTDEGGAATEGNSPQHQAALLSFIDLTDQLQLYAGIRYVDELPNLQVPDYLAIDASVYWRPTESFSVSLTSQNLADGRHVEFGSGRQIERTTFLKFAWRTW